MMMSGQNLTRLLIVLIVANIAFMIGLEIQRRTIWHEEAQYLKAMEAYTLSNVKSQADYDDIRGRLGRIEGQIAATLRAAENNTAATGQIKDIGERIGRIESALSERLPVPAASPGSPPR